MTSAHRGTEGEKPFQKDTKSSPARGDHMVGDGRNHELESGIVIEHNIIACTLRSEGPIHFEKGLIKNTRITFSMSARLITLLEVS